MAKHGNGGIVIDDPEYFKTATNQKLIEIMENKFNSQSTKICAGLELTLRRAKKDESDKSQYRQYLENMGK